MRGNLHVLGIIIISLHPEIMAEQEEKFFGEGREYAGAIKEYFCQNRTKIAAPEVLLILDHSVAVFSSARGTLRD